MLKKGGNPKKGFHLFNTFLKRGTYPENKTKDSDKTDPKSADLHPGKRCAEDKTSDFLSYTCFYKK